MGHYREPIKPDQSPVASGLAKGLRYFWKKDLEILALRVNTDVYWRAPLETVA